MRIKLQNEILLNIATNAQCEFSCFLISFRDCREVTRLTVHKLRRLISSLLNDACTSDCKCWVSPIASAACGLRGCKTRPAPFPGLAVVKGD